MMCVKLCQRSTMNSWMSLTSLKSTSCLLTGHMIIRLSWLVTLLLLRVELTVCLHTSFRKSRNTSMRTSQINLSLSARQLTPHQCYLPSNSMGTSGFVWTTESSMLSSSRTVIHYHLIEEVIGKILELQASHSCLNIIAAFNKLCMHPDSEDLTTFITASEILQVLGIAIWTN